MEELEYIDVMRLKIGQQVYVVDKTLTVESKSITVCEITGIQKFRIRPTINLAVIGGCVKPISCEDNFEIIGNTIKGGLYKEEYRGFLTLQEAIDFRNDLIGTRIGELQGMYL